MASHVKYIPNDKIARPDFARGSIGMDKNPAAASTLKGDVIDKTQRKAIAAFSNNAHFHMGGSSNASLPLIPVTFRQHEQIYAVSAIRTQR